MVHIAGLITLIGSLCFVAVVLFVVSRSRQAEPNGNAPVYKVRKYYAAGLLLALAGLLFFTLPKMVYGAYSADEPAAYVDVTARMWSWQLQRRDAAAGQPLVLPAGKVVAFDVSAADVNHGFGVYDDAGHLLGQTQAMPGYVNRLRMVFDAPGRYHVYCLEYCGLVHHNMVSEFTVQ